MNKSDFINNILSLHRNKLIEFGNLFSKKIESEMATINYKATEYVIDSKIEVPLEYSALSSNDFNIIGNVIKTKFHTFNPELSFKNDMYDDSYTYDSTYYIVCIFKFSFD